MTESASFVPSSEADLHTYVRELTQYEDAPDGLPSDKLNTHIDIAKLRLYNRVDSDKWFTDAGLAQALLGMTAILAKAAVENYSVTSWNVADQEIDVSGMGDEDAAQFQQWAEMVYQGLRNSDATPDYSVSNTANYISGYGPQH